MKHRGFATAFFIARLLIYGSLVAVCVKGMMT